MTRTATRSFPRRPAPGRNSRRTLLLLCLAGAGPTAADVWTEPNPFRREALIEGRDFTYNREAFLQRLSYRHRSRLPTTDRDGVRGTGGSVTGDQLYLDIHAQKTLRFDDGRHGVVLRMQRFEDFDGRFDRQIVGFQRRLGSHWRVALAGDVQGSKGESDVQLEAGWQHDGERLLRLVYVRPELFLNDKGDSSVSFRKEPQTLFLHYRQAAGEGGFAEIAVNHSPEAVVVDQSAGLEAAGGSTRAMAQLRWPTTLPLPGRDAALGLRMELEDANRKFDWDAPPAAGADEFRRRMRSVDLALELSGLRWAPTIGYHGFRLEEDGWFGTARATTGEVRRTEHLGYAGLRLQTGARHRWEPTLLFGHVDASRRFDQLLGENRDESEWVGKLAVPWRYLVDEEANAVLSVNLTLRLHEARFGGGNIQLHWPL
jgi:hypothetical protein